MSDDITLSVVIPAYNEAQKIETDLKLASSYFQSQPYRHEIIVVDDGSTDRTADVVEGVSNKNPQIKILRQNRNAGKGAAIRAGMQAAQGKFALFADAGACVPYDNTERGLSQLSAGADMAFGSRAILRSRIIARPPLYRRLGSMGFQFVVEYVMGLKNIADTQCGFKLFKRHVYRDIFHNLITDGFMFDIEIFLYSLWRRYDLRVFPVDWSNDPDTRFKPVGGSIRNFKELMKIKWHIRNLNQGRVEIQAPP